MSSENQSSLRHYAIVTGAYWVFTLTDGALRMLVLLHLHQRGHSPLEIASLFLLYEFFGVLTNLLGGWIGTRFGLKSTLTAGLGLQVVACGLLGHFADSLSVPLLLLAQGLAGTAKDLTKMSSKSYIKWVVAEKDRRGLMKWVSLLTGSKNTLKGAGFFLGGLLLASLGFRAACSGMAIALMLACLVAGLSLPRATGRPKQKLRWSELVSRDARINWLSAARLFLFGARDIWFVLALPVYLASSLGWGHSQVGAFLALWVIGYGLVQASAPKLAGAEPNAKSLGRWTLALVLPLGGLVAALSMGTPPAATLMIGLAFFGLVFATDSAVHSYLIVAYAQRERIALSVGFYYMSNAMGRLIGTVLSGAIFQFAGQGLPGLEACLAASLIFVLISTALVSPLRRAELRASVAGG